MNLVIPPEIQTLLTRKQTADSLSLEIRKRYAKEYQILISQLARYGIDHPLPAWDHEVNIEIISILLSEIAGKTIDTEWIDEIDVSFRERDQGRFERYVRVARE